VSGGSHRALAMPPLGFHILDIYTIHI